MKSIFKYPLLLVLLPLFVLFAGYSYLEEKGISVPVEVFGMFLLLVLVLYAYLWQKKWKEDREILLQKMKEQERKQ
ncbi:MAG: hypothetical protein HXS46_17435 [Theionarchaea archaeon]|nr:MAG: hypothetical protein AYK18_00845 [Theionarchaea archaeon DG-70]MBU7012466.1 hypothetical protein [Theionarchaea archaeon]